SSIFRPNADLKPLLSYLKQQSIENMVPTVPLTIVQGSKDHLVDPRGTYAYYQQLCKLKKPTIYQTIDGGDHRDALRQSNTFATDFLNAIEKKQAKSYCSNFK
ncbi:MAG: lysophospholipase, partial [Acinetobacter baumannii]|nr:lysophospholipase [Acinetobacter baumannii]